MTNATILTVGTRLNDAELASFYGASDSNKCTVIITDGSDKPTKTGNCDGVTVKDQVQ